MIDSGSVLRSASGIQLDHQPSRDLCGEGGRQRQTSTLANEKGIQVHSCVFKSHEFMYKYAVLEARQCKYIYFLSQPIVINVPKSHINGQQFIEISKSCIVASSANIFQTLTIVKK